MSVDAPVPGAEATAMAIVENGRPAALEGGRRFQLDAEAWARLVRRLGSDPIEVSALWSDGVAVHALFPGNGNDAVIASTPVQAGRYLGLSGVRPALSLPERMIRDLWGFEATEARDRRPLLDHGDWSCTVPLAARPGPAAYPPEPPEFPLDAAEAASGAHQVGFGPVGAPTAGPAHLRLVLNGDRIRRVDPLLGFAHRGVVRMMLGATVETAMVLASRIDASISVACQCAVAEAIERVAGSEVPAPVRGLRSLAVAVEAGTRGLWSLARLARTLGRPDVAGELDRARDGMQDASGACFGHRLMFDLLVPGGMGRAVGEDRLAALAAPIGAALAALAGCEARLRDSCERGTGAAADAVGTLAERRRAEAVRRFELAQEMLRSAVVGGAKPAIPGEAGGWTGEGSGSAHAIRGMVRCWMRLAGGTVSAFHLHDPGITGMQVVRDAAEGLELGRLEVLLAAADVVVPGVDQ